MADRIFHDEYNALRTEIANSQKHYLEVTQIFTILWGGMLSYGFTWIEKVGGLVLSGALLAITASLAMILHQIAISIQWKAAYIQVIIEERCLKSLPKWETSLTLLPKGIPLIQVIASSINKLLCRVFRRNNSATTDLKASNRPQHYGRLMKEQPLSILLGAMTVISLVPIAVTPLPPKSLASPLAIGVIMGLFNVVALAFCCVAIHYLYKSDYRNDLIMHYGSNRDNIMNYDGSDRPSQTDR